jgi:hypothetical protein
MSRFLAIALVASVNLGGGFGSASAEVLSIDDESMEIEVQVEVQTTADAVVVHFVLSDEEPVTLPLVSRGNGVYGITTELKPANYQVLFETLGDPSVQSQPVSLTDLGADIGDTAQEPTSTTEEGVSSATQGWGWLAVAFGAASLAVLAFWVLGGRDDREASVDPDSAESDDDPDELALEDQSPTDSSPDS